MKVDDSEYQSHQVFAELEKYENFYEVLSHGVFSWVSQGIKGALGNIDTYVFSSMEGTLSSIRLILKEGKINDAYALLRKYHDSAIINIYSNLYLEEKFSIENRVVEQIDGWVKGRETLPEYRVMSQYIRSSDRVAQMNDLFLANPHYKGIRDRCNDHTHYNYFQFVLLNDSKVFVRERAKELQQFSHDLRDLFIFHIAYVFFTMQNYMMSSDYIDYLECGMQPEDDSQYRVAPFVQQIFDEVLTPNRPDVVTAIKESTDMHLS